MPHTRLTFSRRNPFKVPDNYFEELEQRVMQRIDEQERSRGPVEMPGYPVRRHQRRILRYLLPLTEMAAAVALVSLIAYNVIGGANQWGDSGMWETKLTKEHAETPADATYEYLMLDNETIYDYATDDY